VHCGTETPPQKDCRNKNCLEWPHGVVLRCQNETIVIGRDCSVVFGREEAPDGIRSLLSQMNTISARHLTVSWSPDGLTLFDDSLNGTSFNGQQIEPRVNHVVSEPGTIVLGRNQTVTIEVVYV
jgi:FHA domain